MKNETVSTPRTSGFFFFPLKQNNQTNQWKQKKQYLAPKVTLQVPAMKKRKKKNMEKYQSCIRRHDVILNHTCHPSKTGYNLGRITVTTYFSFEHGAFYINFSQGGLMLLCNIFKLYKTRKNFNISQITTPAGHTVHICIGEQINKRQQHRTKLIFALPFSRAYFTKPAFWKQQ